jgi:transposase
VHRALVVAVTVVAEVGDIRRFANARQLMADLGFSTFRCSASAAARSAG